jgi:DNA-binding transcriptional LysR family regulator
MIEWRGHFLDSPGGTLEIASTQTVIINRLQPLLQKYHAQYPDVSIRARGTDSPEMERLVAQGRVDLALSTRPPADPDLDYTLWMKTELRVVTPKGHPLARHPKASLDEIAAHPMVLLAHEPGGDRELLDQALRLRGIEAPRVVLETNNSEILLAYVESGMGLTITSATNLLRNRREVESVALAESIGASEVGLLVRKHQHHPARARHLVRMLDPKLEAWLDRHRAAAAPPEPDPAPAPRKRKPRPKPES